MLCFYETPRLVVEKLACFNCLIIFLKKKKRASGFSFLIRRQEIVSFHFNLVKN